MAKGLLDRKQFIALLRKRQGEKSVRQFAMELKIAPQFLGQVYAGTYPPGPSISKAMGFDQITVYRRRVAKVKAKVAAAA